ncbi:MAG: TetR/AcrR family transcriptional regulator, partial [Myxococcota bacterium]
APCARALGQTKRLWREARRAHGAEMKKTYHHGDLRRAALREALGMLEEGGAERLSLRTISQRVGVSHGSLYRHFDGFGDLLGEVTAECFRAFSRHMVAAVEDADDPADALRRACRAYFAYADDHPSRYELMFAQNTPMQSHDGAFKEAEVAFDMLTEVVGAVGADEPRRAAFLAWAQLHGTVELLKHAALPTGLDGHRDALIERATHACVLASTQVGPGRDPTM